MPSRGRTLKAHSRLTFERIGPKKKEYVPHRVKPSDIQDLAPQALPIRQENYLSAYLWGA